VAGSPSIKRLHVLKEADYAVLGLETNLGAAGMAAEKDQFADTSTPPAGVECRASHITRIENRARPFPKGARFNLRSVRWLRDLSEPEKREKS